MRVMGIDPGLRNLGWGVVDAQGNKLRHVANGVIHSVGDDLAMRLMSLHTQLTEIFHAHSPDTAAVEQTFVNKDAVATLKLGQARAIALLVPAQFGLLPLCLLPVLHKPSPHIPQLAVVCTYPDTRSGVRCAGWCVCPYQG